LVSLTNNNWQKVTTTTPLANSPSKTKISPNPTTTTPTPTPAEDLIMRVDFPPTTLRAL